MKMWIFALLFCLFITGCSDVVGNPEFVCPLCGSEKTQLISIGDAGTKAFYFWCAKCGTESGRYENFTEAFKIWKLKNSKGAKL